ncbi:MAG: Holliday junction branch migration DNA helicase RuvB [Candidatus Colwellbacteria bacterium CG23_combo_of_CG06-09_8_20_14_all_42_19]|uniref:Holliday junction branch migration complex subunit RuvB n=1 Tax=Candidatus Colwellbacteria bacterium CG23_combo_of_CG06-09_8_20_14_all_42_19 TaxID=1974541 RepID=A0A2H0AL19_9BACT|nr:MAG: Holliday junction branch migration DNA helicase RuvB [Candidatus Colwellbacteria bacterium CG23_combo_of_CG06-09_8_20_14_all_42_19]
MTNKAENNKKKQATKSLLNNGNNEDQTIDTILRPTKWEDYIGQGNIKRNLKIIIDAAKSRGESSDHLLFYGQAGLGKTTLAKLVAQEMNAAMKITSGPAIEKMGDLAAILSNLEPKDILFIDEAHRLNRMIEEVLYPAMESRKLHIIIGKGAGARTISLDIPPFTLVAATTRIDLLSEPLRSRFGATFRLDYYDEADIEAIIKRSASILSIGISPEAVRVLAKASRFTPRVANRLLKRVRDYMEVYKNKTIDEEVARKTLDILEIDSLGLETHDRLLLRTIIDKFGGGPVGVNTIAASLNEDRVIVENVYEPYLLKLGLIRRTAAGRTAEPLAYTHLGKKPKGKLL